MSDVIRVVSCVGDVLCDGEHRIGVEEEARARAIRHLYGGYRTPALQSLPATQYTKEQYSSGHVAWVLSESLKEHQPHVLEFLGLPDGVVLQTLQLLSNAEKLTGIEHIIVAVLDDSYVGQDARDYFCGYRKMKFEDGKLSEERITRM